MSEIITKICNFMAAACLLFDVEWDEEFQDDDYVIQKRRSEIHAI